MDRVSEKGCQFSLPEGYQLDPRYANMPTTKTLVLVWSPDEKADYETGSFIQFGYEPTEDSEKMLKFHLDGGAEKSTLGKQPGYLKTEEKGDLTRTIVGTFYKDHMYTLTLQGSEAEQAEFKKIQDAFSFTE